MKQFFKDLFTSDHTSNTNGTFSNRNQPQPIYSFQISPRDIIYETTISHKGPADAGPQMNIAGS